MNILFVLGTLKKKIRETVYAFPLDRKAFEYYGLSRYTSKYFEEITLFD